MTPELPAVFLAAFPGLDSDTTVRVMALPIEVEQEDDGRWLAEMPDLPGVLTYGPTRDAAVAAVRALALRVLADRVDHGEDVPPAVADLFAVRA